MVYTYDSLLLGDKSCLPPATTSVQNLTPPKSDIVHDKLLISNLQMPKRRGHAATVTEEETFPRWPRMVGLAPIYKSDKCGLLELNYLFEDGGLFKESFARPDAEIVLDDEDPTFVKTRKQRIDEEEAKVWKEDALEEDVIQNHDKLDARGLMQGMPFNLQ